MLRQNDLIFLLGAGCSVKAGIPTSFQMLQRLHDNLQRGETGWNDHHQLYCWLRAHTMRTDALAGRFEDRFHIERLVSALTELVNCRDNVLFPYILGWQDDFIPSNEGLDKMVRFRRQIIQQLKTWVSVKNYRDSNYYRRLFEIAGSYNYPLRVFTLNYDLCVERNRPNGLMLERGFDRGTRQWDWRRFSRNEGEEEPSIYLYKLHGSMDWERDSKHVLQEVDNTPEEPDLIFGTIHKMQYVDPYLFYFYEFRRCTLECQVVIVIGYSFGDDHINGMMRQALEHNLKRKLVAVSPSANAEEISRLMGHSDLNQIIAIKKGADEFLIGFDIDEVARLAGIVDLDEPFA